MEGAIEEYAKESDGIAMNSESSEDIENVRNGYGESGAYAETFPPHLVTESELARLIALGQRTKRQEFDQAIYDDLEKA